MQSSSEIAGRGGRIKEAYPRRACHLIAEDRDASTLASERDERDRVIQREGRWNFDAHKAYTRNAGDE